MNNNHEKIAELKHRLKLAKRRLARWSGNPGSSTGFGQNLNSENMHMRYGMAKYDVKSLCQMLDSLGVPCEVIDPKETFHARYFNPVARPVYVYRSKIFS